jgi:O-antigen/teichoic acid export membrane protein
MNSQPLRFAVPHQVSRRGLRGAVLFTAATVLSHLCILSVMLILGNVLGPERYGAVTFGLALQSYLFLLGCQGVKQIVVHRGVQHPEQLDHLFTAHLIVTGLAASLAGGGVIMGACFAPISSAERILLSVLAVGNVTACLNIQPLFDAHHQQFKSAAVVLTVEVVGLLFVIGVRSAGLLRVETVGAFFAGKWAMSTVAHYLIYHRTIHRLRLMFVPADVRNLLRSGWPLLFAALVATIPFNAGVFFLRLFHSQTSVALLGLGQQAASAYILAVTIGLRLVQPHAYGPRGLVKAFARKLVLAYGVFLVILLAGMSIAAEVIVNWLLNSSYRSALSPMLVMLGGAFVYGIGGLTSVYLIVFRQERFILIANACASLIYLAAGCIVIPHTSCTGAAVLTTASASLTSVLLIARLWICHRTKSKR